MFAISIIIMFSIQRRGKLGKRCPTLIINYFISIINVLILSMIGRPREYLEAYVFPVLLPAIEQMLIAAKENKVFEVCLKQ